MTSDQIYCVGLASYLPCCVYRYKGN